MRRYGLRTERKSGKMADFRLKLAAKGNLVKYLDSLPNVYARSTTAVLRRKGTALKKKLRQDVQSAGLGTRLGNAIRSEVFPRRGVSMEARGRVFSKALVKRDGALVDLINVFNTGTVIRAKGRGFLAIPLIDAGQRRTPKQWPRGTLFVKRGPGRGNSATGILVSERAPDVPLFVLVRQVRINKRLNVEAIQRKVLKNTNVLLARDMERRAQRLVAKLGG